MGKRKSKGEKLAAALLAQLPWTYVPPSESQKQANVRKLMEHIEEHK